MTAGSPGATVAAELYVAPVPGSFTRIVIVAVFETVVPSLARKVKESRPKYPVCGEYLQYELGRHSVRPPCVGGVRTA